MLDFFTDPYKDELIYSAIARYHFYTGNIDFKDTIEECFGKRSIIPSLEIGSNLDTLSKHLGSMYSADMIIKKHTIFPYYSPFLPFMRNNELVKDIKHKNGSGLYTKLGLIAGSICKKDGIYYCPICAQKDIEIHGEPYIHREHQLQGVFLCPHDGAKLKKYGIDRKNSSRIEFVRLDRKCLNFSISNVEEKYNDLLFDISKNAYFLLKTDLSKISKETIQEKYKHLLYERGLTTSNGTIKQNQLYEEFSAFYNKEFLNALESSIDNEYEYNWLRVATRNSKRTVHPIRHLLIINFLESDIEKFFKEIDKTYNPFGTGPWPCLNKIAPHYKQEVVTHVVITEDSKTRLPVGTFTCECGFAYSRKGPDKVHQDRYKFGRVKAFGSVWEEKLRGLLKKEEYNLLEVAKIMKCDPKTIIKYDRSLGINYFKNSNMKIKVKRLNRCNEDKLDEYKETILNAVTESKDITRNRIRENYKKEYSYLYNKDKIWLDKNLPTKTQNNKQGGKVDWNKRDVEILELVRSRYEELMLREVPIRITKSSIGKASGSLTLLENHMNKLPLTEEYLNGVIETVQTFQIRRCKKIINEKIDNDEQIKLWEVQRTAGIRSENFDLIKENISDYLN